ncbi:MAG TPA: methyl-accepting chemotaxis protein [Spirochaetota bacterium]|nr:methyl-accepting chemotaxis protein [Spirochaetota bacterium]
MTEPKDYEKQIKNFFFKFTIRTEGISYFTIVPLIVFNVWSSLNFTPGQWDLFFMMVLIITPVSFITTQVNNYIAVAPVLRYFNKMLRGKEFTDDEYQKAHRRLLYLPRIHGIGAFFRWVAGLGGVIIPMQIIGAMTPQQTFGMWMMLIINAPLGAVLYYLLTELIVQKILITGIFPRWPRTEIKNRMSLFTKLTLSIMMISFIPFAILLTYFIVFITDFNFDKTMTYVKISIIAVIGLAGSVMVAAVLNRTIISKVKIIIDFLDKVGTGDLVAAPAKIAIMDELTVINMSVFKMRNNLKSLVEAISGTVETLEKSSGDMVKSSFKQSDRARELAAIIEELTSSFEEMAASSESNMASVTRQVQQSVSVKNDISRISEQSGMLAKETWTLSEKAKDSVSIAEEGEKQINKSVSTISNLIGYMDTIDQTAGMINDIADQINLLALNAAIEAARAGEHGKGFAVVADEVNKLADKTTELAKIIKKEISEHTKNINTELSQMTHSVDTFHSMKESIGGIDLVIGKVFDFTQDLMKMNEEIKLKIDELNRSSNEINNASQEQKHTNDELMKSVTSINAISQSTAEEAHIIQDAATKFGENSKELQKVVSRFKIKYD